MFLNDGPRTLKQWCCQLEYTQGEIMKRLLQLSRWKFILWVYGQNVVHEQGSVMFLGSGIHGEAWKVCLSDVGVYWWLFSLWRLNVQENHIRKENLSLPMAQGTQFSGDTVYHSRKDIATEPAPADATRREKLLAPTLLDKEAEEALAGSTVAYDSPLGLHLSSCLHGQGFPHPATRVPKVGPKCSPMSLSTFKW